MENQRSINWQHASRNLKRLITIGLISLWFAGCMDPSAPNDVNLTPIFEMPLPEHITNLEQIVDSEMLRHFANASASVDSPRKDFLSVAFRFQPPHGTDRYGVGISRFDIEQRAIEEFHVFCQAVPPMSQGIYKSGEGVAKGVPYRYCINSLRRTPTDAPFMPGPWVDDGIVVQKKNLVIVFGASTSGVDRTIMNTFIQHVADAIRAKTGK